MFSSAERDRRWAAIRRLMQQKDLEVVIACSDGGDHIPAHQRYISGYRSLFGYAVVLLFRDGGSELIVDYPATQGYAKALSWIDDPVSTVTSPFVHVDPTQGLPTVGAELVKQLNRRGVSRIGIADLEHFPAQWKEEIAANLPSARFSELGPDLYRMRWTKSADELDAIRDASRIADEIWTRIPEIVTVGRREEEAVAEIEQIVRSQGGEQSYNLLLRMPMFQDPVTRAPWEGSSRKIERGDLYTVEISPRVRGYYSQLTALVSLGPVEAKTRAAYDALVRGREAGLKVMKGGVDIFAVQDAIFSQFRRDGYEPSSPLIGHLCGLELDDGLLCQGPLTLEPGMAVIIHPWVIGFPALMHADTFIITEGGYEQVTHNSLQALELDV